MPDPEYQAQCKHTYLPQAHYPPLPPFYTRSTLSASTLRSLHAAACSHHLGRPRARGPFTSHTVRALRKELEEGMSPERREQLMLYVLGIHDARERRAAQLYLARYPGFFVYEGSVRGEVRLDFSVGDRFVGDGVFLDKEGEKDRHRERHRKGKKREWYEGWFERDLEKGREGEGDDESAVEKENEGWCVTM